MDYYIQGDAANADKIKTAFEQLGYDLSWPEGCANPDVINIGFERNGAKYVVAETAAYIRDIIKTHPDYKELELPVQPKFKFKVGDWIVQNDNGTVSQITKVINAIGEDGEYRAYEHTNGYFHEVFENEYHLWTIADAKDGDIIGFNDCTHNDGSYIDWVGIYKQASETNQHLFHCVMPSCRSFRVGGLWRIFTAYPATKEQRDLLFKKMKEAGYQWDAEKKELRKIQPHYDIKNFKPFDHCRFKPTETHDWIYADFWYVQAHYKVEHLSAIEKWES